MKKTKTTKITALKSLREKLGLSQTELGSLIGIRQSHFSACEIGSAFLSYKVAKVLISFANKEGVTDFNNTDLFCKTN